MGRYDENPQVDFQGFGDYKPAKGPTRSKARDACAVMGAMRGWWGFAINTCLFRSTGKYYQCHCYETPEATYFLHPERAAKATMCDDGKFGSVTRSGALSVYRLSTKRRVHSDEKEPIFP